MENSMQKKVEAKIPSWKGLELPSSLSFEQCSSEKTAQYKLRFVPEGSEVNPESGAVVSDLTGGLGVDSMSFAHKASVVHYFEQNTALFEAVSRNFSKIQLDNCRIVMNNITVGPDTEIPDSDLIFLDPARRSSAGKKVFLLEDCTPNVLELLPMLLRHTRRILMKLSPMADITLVTGRLSQAGSPVSEVHVVESDGEVKELLIYMEAGRDAELCITATDLTNSFTFTRSMESSAAASFACPNVGDSIFVPAKSLLKAGAFNCMGMPRLSEHSHLYIADTVSVASIRPFGKKYVVEELLPMSAKTIKELSGKYPKADVSCHDVPLRSEELSKRLKSKSGGEYHLFATSSTVGNLILVCRKTLRSDKE